MTTKPSTNREAKLLLARQYRGVSAALSERRREAGLAGAHVTNSKLAAARYAEADPEPGTWRTETGPRWHLSASTIVVRCKSGRRAVRVERRALLADSPQRAGRNAQENMPEPPMNRSKASQPLAAQVHRLLRHGPTRFPPVLMPGGAS